ncbi:GntR family transcriptional regulator [Aeromicrobium yanjiei]|uniref:GntR family transcriptional regulator n=1 Tax=Aeromicrobium yanjiei TaxID=2662028 RepID=A0A5Q2MBY5_9ACTN|nr:GntR family transcriptional regulator [Aeromicrobium yanjiei]QGG40597.1 GntR family transcriptional regulator [Aeromicrobium yanjiei]
MPTRTGDNRAAYLVLADDLRGAIRRGEYAGDRQLPTETSLASDHGLSRQTVRRAYLELVAEGLVDRVPGRGTFVAERDPKYLRQFGSVEDLMGFALDTTVTIVRPLSRGVSIEAAARLGLDTDVVHSLSYVRSHAGVPFGWTVVSVPPAVAVLLEEAPEVTTAGASNPVTVIGLLEGRLSDPIAQAEQTISAVAADARLAEVLGCGEGVPLLRIDRLFVSGRGEPIELSVGHFLPEQYTYRTSLRRSAR